MALFRFPVNSPYAVAIPASRLISDTPQVIDDIHGERVERLQELFDSYELPAEAHPEAMLQFAVVGGMTGAVSFEAVAKMRALLVAASLPRDTDLDAVTVDRYSGSVQAESQEVNWALQLEDLVDHFKTAADELGSVSRWSKRGDRAITAVVSLGWTQHFYSKETEALLALCAKGRPRDFKAYDLKPRDFEPLIQQYTRYFQTVSEYIVAAFPKVTKRYLKSSDQAEIVCGVMWLASISNGMLAVMRNTYGLSAEADSVPNDYHESMRGICSDRRGALNALRLFRFAAMEMAKERVRAYKNPLMKRYALNLLDNYKLR